jgi:hypothetical protein
MRNSQKLDNNWLWEYYKQEGGKLEDPQVFINNFYFAETPIVMGGRTMGVQRENRDLSSFFEDMDRKFQLHTLWSKDGQFIKVVE